MLVSNNDTTIDSSVVAPPRETGVASGKIVEVLSELLTHSIRLRDLYKFARWQTSDLQFHRLYLVFDGHYQEQIRLVDVLIDRVRMLGGVRHVFAGDFLQGTQFSYALRCRASPIRLLRDLLDAHELVLITARPTGLNNERTDRSWTRDFAVGQVVLTNDLQSVSVAEHLAARERTQRLKRARFGLANGYE
jgi:starvation-inducible DNA-binding protein